MKNTVIAEAFILLFMSCGSIPVQAEPAAHLERTPAGKGMHYEGTPEKLNHGERHAEAMGKILRLSDSQWAQYRALLNDDMKARKNLARQLAENRESIHEKMAPSGFNEAELKSLAEKQGQLIAMEIIAPALMRQKFRTLLTQEQRDLEERVFPLIVAGVRRPHFPRGEAPPGGMGGGIHLRGEEEPQIMGKIMPPHCNEDE